jgi:hypothetical protein
MSNGQLAGSWSAWYDFWSSKTYAMARLRECGNRLHAPEKTRVFVQWKDEWRAEMNAAELAALVAQAAGLDQERTSLGDELREARAELATARELFVEENRLALERLTIELTGTAEQVHAMQAAIDKEQRVELLRRQSMRRILNRGLADGWSAWLELWQAKRYALDRLKQVGNQLRAPEKMNAFHGWLNELEQAREAARLAELQAHSSSLDTQLRRAKAELTNFKMVTTARDDEIACQKSLCSVFRVVEWPSRACVLTRHTRRPVLRHCYCPFRIHTPYMTPYERTRHGACARLRRRAHEQ